MMKLFGSCLLGSLLSFGGAMAASAQAPSSLSLRLFAGVNIIGEVGSVYVVQSTTNVTQSNSWTSIAFVQLPVTNYLFVDTSGTVAGSRFYRSVLQSAPTNMVFIPPNTFRMGSPTNEDGHQPDEGPQTTVTLTHGYWIGKYEVTQGEYLAVTGKNPSFFTNNPSRPVESVGWPDATNFCALLTARELQAGRIPPGSHFRLPTEAEWEYAARAGTSTRFYYGDDPSLTSLTNYAWFSGNFSIGTLPVGQKLPNAWGLYDMEGNVWEWCSDWYGPYPGGFQIDPQGPLSNAVGVKITRGGAWDYFDLDCRSARRGFFGVSPFLFDFDLGFRVVLATP